MAGNTKFPGAISRKIIFSAFGRRVRARHRHREAQVQETSKLTERTASEVRPSHSTAGKDKGIPLPARRGRPTNSWEAGGLEVPPRRTGCRCCCVFGSVPSHAVRLGRSETFRSIRHGRRLAAYIPHPGRALKRENTERTPKKALFLLLELGCHRELAQKHHSARADPPLAGRVRPESKESTSGCQFQQGLLQPAPAPCLARNRLARRQKVTRHFNLARSAV